MITNLYPITFKFTDSKLNNNKEYTIYTTGIAEWGKLDNMYKYWNETLCSKICNTIPLTFNIINIKSYFLTINIWRSK